MNKEKTFYDKHPFFYYDPEKEKLVMETFPLGGFVKKYIKKDSVVVDVGCGCGIKASYILKRVQVRNYTGIDLSKESLKIAQNFNPGIKIINASNTELPILSNFADIVISDGVIHHTELPTLHLKKSLELQRKGLKSISQLIIESIYFTGLAWGRLENIKRN